MMTVEDLEKRLEYLDSKLSAYAHRPEIQFALIAAMAQTQLALIETCRYTQRTLEDPPAIEHPQVNWTPEPRK